MHSVKQQFLNGLHSEVLRQCHVHFASDAETSEAAANVVLGMQEPMTTTILTQVVESLPDFIYFECTSVQQEEMKRLISYEFILFQGQENPNDDNYPLLFVNFTEGLSRDVMAQFFTEEVQSARG